MVFVDVKQHSTNQTLVTRHKSAVSLLESGEQRCIKAINTSQYSNGPDPNKPTISVDVKKYSTKSIFTELTRYVSPYERWIKATNYHHLI